MREFRDRIAVVTGAASGIGLATAHRLADEGMHLVLADIEQDALDDAEAAIGAKGVDVLAARTDVMSEDAVNELADAAFDRFGTVHIVFNNAGVAATAATLRARAWEGSLADWEWTMGVNFMGVLYGVRAFVPRMLDNGDEGHIVNTASIAGLVTGANPYNVSKHGVVLPDRGDVPRPPGDERPTLSLGAVPGPDQHQDPRRRAQPAPATWAGPPRWRPCAPTCRSSPPDSRPPSRAATARRWWPIRW